MNPRERAGVVARIRHLRGVSPAISSSPGAAEAIPGPQLGRALERITHLEELLEGLQDSVYRESQRQSKRISELEARLDPPALAAELSRDARERGL